MLEDLKTRFRLPPRPPFFSPLPPKIVYIFYMEEKKIKGRKHVKLKCAHSGEYFWKDKSEYTRRIKINPDHKFYKSIKDAALGGGEKHYSQLKPHMGVVSDNLKNACDNRKDKYSPFRYFIKRAKYKTETKKTKFQSFNITLTYLKNLWENQNGICAISGVKMELPASLSETRGSPFCASLDRIDSEIGYIQGNVQFVTQFCNLGKRDFETEKILNFIQAIKSANK